MGGIHLEDISQPSCFAILDRLRAEMKIPVWHDDQQGSATVLLAGLLNALKVVNKRLESIKIARIGVGAANVATYRLLKASGVDPAGIVACDRQGTLHQSRDDIERTQSDYADKWRICQETNADRVIGGIADAMRRADVCIAFSAPGPDLIRPQWIQLMAVNPVVFACANPIPEIWPWDAKEAGARIVATGRSDFPNQVNNSLGFPGIFRGTLDVRARTITDEMARGAADELARAADAGGLSDERIVPRMDEWEVVADVAVATGLKAQKQGVATLSKSRGELHREAMKNVREAHETTRLFMRESLIADALA